MAQWRLQPRHPCVSLRSVLGDQAEDQSAQSDAIIKHIPPPRAHAGEGFKLLAANLDYSDYLGRIAFGKIYSGKVKVGDTSVGIHGDGRKTTAKITAIFHFEGLRRIEIPEAHAGDVVGLTGFDDVFIGETITDSETRAPLLYMVSSRA